MDIIEKYIEYAEECTKTDESYHRFCGYVIISQTVIDRLHMELPFGTYRPNLWLLLIGPSTLSRKTTAMYLAQDIVTSAGLDNFMPTDFSPEGLLDYMEKCPRGYMWVDEIGGLFAAAKKDYMGSTKELLMKLYSGKSVHKELVKGSKFIQNPSLGMVGTTTPETMKKTFGVDDMFSGFGARFLQVYHSGNYRWRAMQWLDKSITKKRKALVDAIKDLRIRFQNDKKAVLSDAALKLFNQWDKKIFEMLDNEDHADELNSLYGRIIDYTIKLAMIIEVSKSWNKIKITDKTVDISVDSMEQAIVQMNDYRKTINFKVRAMLHGTQRMYVYEKISKHEPIGRSRLLRMTHMTSKDLDTELETLIQMGLVCEDKKITDGRPKTLYKTTQVSLTC